jgi:hypothetical protein
MTGCLRLPALLQAANSQPSLTRIESTCGVRGRSFLLEHLIHEPVMNIDPPRIGAVKITDKLLEGRRILKRIIGEDLEKLLRLRLQARGCKLLGILEGLLAVDDAPLHQSSFLALLASGSAMPCLMDSRIPGTESR